MTFIKPTTLLVGALCLTETAAEADVKFNTNLLSAFGTPALGHSHGLYTSANVPKSSGSYVAPSECKTECETVMTTAISS